MSSWLDAAKRAVHWCRHRLSQSARDPAEQSRLEKRECARHSSSIADLFPVQNQGYAMAEEKAKLLQDLEEVQAELARLDQMLKERGEYGYGKGDPAVYQWEFNLSLRNQFQQRLEQIENALQHIEEGSYGLCGICGRAIEPARLEALPFTSLCIDCARSRE